jgi:fatty acid desaturase
VTHGHSRGMFAMQAVVTTRTAPLDPSARDELLRLGQRSNARGLSRLAGHLLALGTAGLLHALALARAPLAVSLVTGVALGFTLATMFAAMHECVHRTAFKSRWLNDGVAWFAGLLSCYNSTFYRPYHAAHHRHTQIQGADPELDEPKPRRFTSYLFELSGLPWWLGKVRTHVSLALGRTAAYPFLDAESAPRVVRSVRWQLFTYAVAAALSPVWGEAYLVTFWLVPLALGQPLLRAILLAEHTGCSEDDNPLTNTRTTHTVFPIRFLMWEMPYHAEHHRYPALPFFSLRAAHADLGPHLAHVTAGYARMHGELVKSFGRRRAEGVEPTA